MNALTPILTALRLADVAMERCNDDHGSDEVRAARRALAEALPMAQAMVEPERVYDCWPADPTLRISRVAQELIHALGDQHLPTDGLRLSVAAAIGALQSIRRVQPEVYPRHVNRRLV